MREGYKKTEVGVIPEDWEVVLLSDICEVNPKKDILENDDEVAFLPMEQVSNSGRIIKIHTRKYEEVSKGYTPFKNKDVLLAKITPCFENGKRALVENLQYKMGFGSTEFHVLRSLEERVMPKYLYYCIDTHRFKELAERNMTGSAGQKRVPTTFLKDFKLPIPPLKEQEKISEILSTVDSQIDDTEKLIEKSKELKKGLMQKLLTKGISHSEFKKTEIGEIPASWSVKKLKDLVEIVNGGTPDTNNDSYWNNGNIKWATPTDITKNMSKYINKTEKLITENGLKNSSARILPVGSILMSSRATIGERAINTVPMCTNQGFKSLICTDKINNEYLYYYIHLLRSKMIRLASGSTFLEISKKEVENMRVSVPSLDEQIKIGEILSCIDNNIENYETKKQKLEEFKKGLMQQLLTGKIRVTI